MPRKKEATFEENLAELEAIVARLENGEGDLATVVADYTKGMELSVKCLNTLQGAAKQMDILLERTTGEASEGRALVIEEE